MRSDRPSRRPSRGEARLCYEGDVWTIVYEGRLLRLRDTKGLHYLAVLLQHPGRPFHVTELMALAARPRVSGGRDGDAERTRKAVTNRIRQSMARIRAAHDALGRHLHNAVHTGTLCRYTPDRPSAWVCSGPVASLPGM